MKLFHTLFGLNACKRNLVWRQNVLMCSVCGRVAGFRYQLGDGDDSLRIFVFPSFEDQYESIRKRPDTHKIVQANDILGHISFVDFATAIMEMKEKVADITYHGFDGLGFFTPSDDVEEGDRFEDDFEEADDENDSGDRDCAVGVDGRDGGAGAADAGSD